MSRWILWNDAIHITYWYNGVIKHHQLMTTCLCNCQVPSSRGNWQHAISVYVAQGRIWISHTQAGSVTPFFEASSASSLHHSSSHCPKTIGLDLGTFVRFSLQCWCTGSIVDCIGRINKYNIIFNIVQHDSPTIWCKMSRIHHTEIWNHNYCDSDWSVF